MTTNGFPDWNINGVIPIGNNALDANGSKWWLDGEIAGWDSPDMRMTMLTRLGQDPTSDGEIAADLHYKGRDLQMNLTCAANSEANRELSRYLLAQAMDLTLSNGNTGIFYGNEVIPKQLTIQRASNLSRGRLVMAGLGLSTAVAATPGWTAGPTGQVYLFSAAVEMYAADPRKYAQTPQTVAGTSSLAVTTVGNTASQNMKLTLTYATTQAGPVTVAFAGRTLRLLVPTVPAGGPSLNPIPAQIVIDVYNKKITDLAANNYFYTRDLSTPWPVLPAASTHTMTISPTPLSASLVFSDAWI